MHSEPKLRLTEILGLSSQGNTRSTPVYREDSTPTLLPVWPDEPVHECFNPQVYSRYHRTPDGKWCLDSYVIKPEGVYSPKGHATSSGSIELARTPVTETDGRSLASLREKHYFLLGRAVKAWEFLW